MRSSCSSPSKTLSNGVNLVIFLLISIMIRLSEATKAKLISGSNHIELLDRFISRSDEK